MKFRSPTLIGTSTLIVISATAQVGPPPPTLLCYESVTRSCGEKHADTTRECWSLSGSVFLPCGDIILFHGSYGDVIGGATGKTDIEPNCGWGIPASIHKFECRNATQHNVECHSLGIHNAIQCKNRCPTGNDCEAVIG